MIQGVTVLRLHLFELEKVNELCRDFCSRYTDCLRRNLHTDQILRNDGMDSENSNGSISASGSSQQNGNQQPHPVHIPPNSTMYQMAPTPQGLIAQHVHVSAFGVFHQVQIKRNFRNPWCCHNTWVLLVLIARNFAG